MNHVLYGIASPVAAEVTANGTRVCEGGVRCTSHDPQGLDDTIALNNHRDQWAFHHVVTQRWEVVPVHVFFVVLFKDSCWSLLDLQSLEYDTLLFDAVEDLPSQPTTNSVGLNEDEGVLLAWVQ